MNSVSNPPKPLISIILPTKDRAHVLRRSIESVLSQTYSNWELIVVDDGSEDETENVVASFGDNRITYLHHASSRGAGAARNTGIRATRGDLIAFQDSDDEWLPQKLEVQWEVLKKLGSGTGMVYSPMMRVNFNGKETLYEAPIFRSGDRDTHQRVLGFGAFGIGIQSCLLRASVFQKVGLFEEGLHRMIDFEFFLRVAKQFTFQYIDEPLVRYFETKGSLSADANAAVEAHRFILERYRDELRTNDTLLFPHEWMLGRKLMRAGRMREGRAVLWKWIRKGKLGYRNTTDMLLFFGGYKIYRQLKARV